LRIHPEVGQIAEYGAKRPQRSSWLVSQTPRVGFHSAKGRVTQDCRRGVAWFIVATRAGATGRGGAVAQVDVIGLIATGYNHYDSRAGDPHLHTHVVISNKVQTVLDGKRRSLGGRPMRAATVALSELHEAVFADHLTRMFGVKWEARDMGRNRNPAWARKLIELRIRKWVE
jgi:hypothetical protein